MHIKTELDIHILNEAKTTHNELIPNAENLTILIGLSPVRTGSTYIHLLLQTSFDILHYRYIQSDPQELKYWDTCIIPYHNYFNNEQNKINTGSNDDNCNFNDYLNEFIESTDDSLDTKHYKYILFEKTPSYIRYYHSCYLLSHYSKLYNIYFYVSLRNPIHRTWYEYWMHFNFKYNQSNPIHINKMMDEINDGIDTFPHTYPKYQLLLDYIQINNDSVNSNNDINEEKVVDLWIDATYDIFNNLDYNSFKSKADINDVIEGKRSAFNVPIFAISLYYPQLLMWYYTFKNNTINLSDRLKIFQFEPMVNEINGPQNVIKELLLWMNDEQEQTQTLTNFVQIYNNRKLNNNKYFEKVNQLEDDALKIKLDKLYNDCNLRLYWFLNEHSDLLLFQDRIFQF